ncbi:MAG: lipopolysaccharide heptosyltransferase I [Methylobacter sp.]|nr:MAG: lipopolysaccharide heptosyltransferase I [Methylobacter sp.]
MRIGIVKLSALGDIVHAMVALQFIKAQISDVEIDWIVEERFAQLLQYNPDIDKVLAVNLKALKTDKTAIFRQLGQVRRYARNRYDLVIDAQGLIKSALTAKLLGAPTAGFDVHSIRERFASWFYDIKINCSYDTNTIDRNACVLSRPLGFEITPAQILAKKPFLFFNDRICDFEPFLSRSHKNILFVTSSTWESRNYPLEKYAEAAEALQQNGLLIWGNDKERQQVQALAQRSAYLKVLPKLDLNALKALIARMDLVIGNDTGPTHMAWALNRPSITLFGPTPVSRVYQTPINKVIKSDSTVNPFKLNKLDFSIREIAAPDVIRLALEILDS